MSSAAVTVLRHRSARRAPLRGTPVTQGVATRLLERPSGRNPNVQHAGSPSLLHPYFSVSDVIGTNLVTTPPLANMLVNGYGGGRRRMASHPVDGSDPAHNPKVAIQLMLSLQCHEPRLCPCNERSVRRSVSLADVCNCLPQGSPSCRPPRCPKGRCGAPARHRLSTSTLVGDVGLRVLARHGRPLTQRGPRADRGPCGGRHPSHRGGLRCPTAPTAHLTARSPAPNPSTRPPPSTSSQGSSILRPR